MRLLRLILSFLIVLSLVYYVYLLIPANMMTEWKIQLGRFVHLIGLFGFILFFIVADTLISKIFNLIDKTFEWIIGSHYGLLGRGNREKRIHAKKAVYALVRFRNREAAILFSHAGLFIPAARCFEKVPDTFSAAEAYRAAKDYVRAAEMFQRGEKFESAADCYVKLGDLESAMKCYSHVAERLLSEGKHVLAAEAYLKARNYQRAGDLLEKSGYLDQAAEAREKAGDDLQAAELYLRSAKEQSQRLLKTIPSSSPPPLSAQMLAQTRKAGELFLKKELYEKAIEAFQMLGEAERVAEIYKNKGDLEKAAKLYEQSEMWIKAQQCYERLGSQTDVLRMDAHLALKNKQLQQAAVLFEQLRDYQQALDIYKILRDDAGQAHCLEKLGRPLVAAQYYTKSNNLLKAAELFEEYGDWNKAAAIYHELGMLQQASRCVSKSNNLFYAAILEREKGNLEEAIDILRTVPHQLPEYPKSMLLLAQCYLDMDRASLAADVFERVIPSLTPNTENIENFYLYGCVLEKTENFQYALEIFKKVQDLIQDYKDVKDRIREIETQLSLKPKITLQNLTQRRVISPLSPFGSPLTVKHPDKAPAMDDSPTVLESPDTMLEEQKTVIEDQMTSVEGFPSSFYDHKTLLESDQAPSLELPDRFQKIQWIGKPSYPQAPSIFKARDRNSGKIVALKTYPLSLWKSRGEMTLFREHFINVSRLEHPHIIPIYESGELKNEWYISMELCEGGNLHQLVDHEGPLTPLEALQLVQRLTEALAYAHNNNIIHGNIKPTKILFTGKGSPKLGDFSFHKLFRETTGRSSVPETGDEEKNATRLSFMAPEQLRGESPEKWSDLYSLGLCFFFMVTGKSPLELMGRITPEEIMDAHYSGSLPLPGKITKNVFPKELDDLYLMCTNKDPEKRIKSARELLGVIQMIKAKSHEWTQP